MKIGITERGDAGIDLSWAAKMDKFDGAIIITKNLNDNVINLLIQHKDKTILHCGCTGMGGTRYEPNVPEPECQLRQLAKLVQAGYNPGHVVLRIDPIIPTTDGIKLAESVLIKFQQMQNENSTMAGINRIRISVIDMYPHVRKRFASAGIKNPYGEKFYAPANMMNNLRLMLSKFPYVYETCAEPYLNHKNIIHTGCISEKDLNIFGLKPDNAYTNPQKRNGCLCLSCKTEMLTCKHPCPHCCLYCYWKD